MNASPQEPSGKPDRPNAQSPAKADWQGLSDERAARKESARTKAMGMNVAVLGMEMGVSVAVMTFLGWWLDGRYDTAPWFTLAGVGIGIGGGMYALFVQARKLMKK